MLKHCNTAPLRAAALVAAVAAGSLLAAAPAPAQTVRATSSSYVPGTMGVPQPEPLVTVSVKNRSLARVLSEIFKQTSYDYKLESGLGNQLYSVDAAKMPLTQALKQVIEQDKQPEPLVWSFQRNLTSGIFILSREYLQLGVKEGEKKVSLSNARLTKVLPELFKLMEAKGRIEPDVPPIPISVELRPSNWANVLPQLMLEAYKVEPALTYSMDGDTIVVHLQKTPTGIGNAAQAATQRKVKLALNEVPLRDALSQLFQGSQWKYQVSEKVKDVKITFASTSEPELGALVAILHQAAPYGQQVTYREGKGLLYIEPGPLPGEFQVSKAGNVRTTSLDVKGKKISEVAKLLEGALGVTIRVSPNVPDLPINFRIVDAPADVALKALIQAAMEKLPNINYRPMGAGYLIELG